MAFEQRDNNGALFKNEKEKDTQPDYKGKAMVDGEEYEVAAWVKKSKAGNMYMSLSFSSKEEGMARRAGADFNRPQARSAPEAQRRGSYTPPPFTSNDDMDLPF